MGGGYFSNYFNHRIRSIMNINSDEFLTISTPSEGIYKEKGSKFIALAFPVKTEDDIKDILAELRKNYYDARHHCYAYMLGAERKIFRANDDGEPSGTAGRPILGQIESKKLTNVLIVIIRYFGGILLGAGGLVHAYKTAAAESLNNSKIITGIVCNQFTIEFEYIHMPEVMRILKEKNGQQINAVYTEICQITISVRQSKYSEIIASLQKMDSIKIINL
jgi:uncharacterized YigZ family protein